MKDGKWMESEIDIIACNKDNILVGECKYRNKKTGLKELQELKNKSQFLPVKNRKIHYLLASKSGFTKETESDDVILIDQV